MPGLRRIVLIGHGAIGRPIAERLAENEIPGCELVGVLTTRPPAEMIPGVGYFTDMDDVMNLDPDMVIEAAGAEVFGDYAVTCLESGVDLMAVSLAALADHSLEARVRDAVGRAGSRLYAASGAIGALEALTSAREAGLSNVTLTQRKPLRAFPGVKVSPSEETVVSSGSAREAALAFPKNSNIAAAVALAGVGFDETRVTVIADPKVDANIAELHASGTFGEFSLSIRNRPSDLNPSTARLAGLSVIAALRRMSAPIVVPA